MDKAALTIYLVVLVLSPLLFGAIHTYAYTIMALGVLTGALLLMIKDIRKDPKSGIYQFQFPNTSLNLAFFLLLVFLTFQVVPLPGSFLEFLSPEARVVGQKSLPASSAMVPYSQSKSWFALAPYAYPVRMSIIRFTVYGLFFLGLTQALNSQKRIELAVFLVLLTGCFEALYGLAEAYSGSGHIWWFKKSTYGSQRDVTGTYINRNHLAGFIGMGLLLAASFSAALSGQKKKRKIAGGRKSSLKTKFLPYLSGEERLNRRALILFAGVVMGIGLIFSASRGGIIAAAGAMLCMSLLLVFRKDHRRKGFILLFLFLITAAYALYIGVEHPVERFKYLDRDWESRSRYAQKTMDMFKDYKLAGIGVGNFQYAYPRYQAPEDKEIFIPYAHNDWAQFLAEAGIAGLCSLLAGISYYLYRTMRLWKKRSDPFAVCLGVAAPAAMVAMAIHSTSDFNFHIPANFLTLVAIMAIGYSALHLDGHHRRGKTLYRYHIMPLRYKGVFVFSLLLGLIFWTGSWTIRHFVAEVHCNTVPNSTLNRDQNPPLEEIQKAISWDSWNAQYWYKLARVLMRVRNSEFGMWNNNDEERYNKQTEIITALEKAVHLNPFQAEYHLRLGLQIYSLWWQPDYYERWLPAADLSMDRAAYFAGEKNPWPHVTMGNYWVMRSKTMLPSDPAWQVAWAKACRHYQKAQNLEKGKHLRDGIEKFVWRFYPDREMIERALVNGTS